MGSMQASEMAGQVTQGALSLCAAMDWHLQFNHYPPVPAAWSPVCIAVVERFNGGDTDLTYMVDNPVRDSETVEASKVVTVLHLDSFLTHGDFLDEENEP